MGDKVQGGIWGSMMGIMTPILGIMAYMGLKKRDDNAFHKMVTDKGLTNPRDVWNACLEYNKEARAELAEAKATIEAAKEICAVADGLISVRKMVEDHDPPAQVKQAIISHWWTKLMQLFVPWGIVMPEEVDARTKKNLYFRLASIVDPGAREAILRAYVYQYKESAEGWKRMYEDTFDYLTPEERSAMYRRKYEKADEREDNAARAATSWSASGWSNWFANKKAERKNLNASERKALEEAKEDIKVAAEAMKSMAGGMSHASKWREAAKEHDGQTEGDTGADSQEAETRGGDESDS